MKEELLIVNIQDRILGKGSKTEIHSEKGILHRAITVFIFNKRSELLITKRSDKKRLWPNIWESSCSTHVHKGETYEQSGEKRLQQELGFSCPLKFLFKFKYKAKYKHIGIENEICGLLFGRYNKEILPNSKEIKDYKWISINQLKKNIKDAPKNYAPWLKIALEKYLLKKYKNTLIFKFM